MIEVRILKESDKASVLRLCEHNDDDYVDNYLDMLNYYYDFETEHMFGIFVYGELVGLATTGYNDDYYTTDEGDMENLRKLGASEETVKPLDEYLIISNVYIARTHRGNSYANCLMDGIIGRGNNVYVIHPICDKIKEYYLKCEHIFPSNNEPTILLGFKKLI